MTDERRRLQELSPVRSMSLLASVPLGRIVFTARALPAVRPASHLVIDDRVIVRADSGVASWRDMQTKPYVIGSTGAAIANAFFDATGVRLRQYPMTPERVRAALANAKT